MAAGGKLKVALVGLKFGGAFPAIYADHPDVAEIAVCDVDPKVLREFADEHGFHRRFDRIEDVLVAAEVKRSLFHTAYGYAELFTLYGENGTFAWQMENEFPVLFKAGPVGNPKGRGGSTERVVPSDSSARLPESIRKYSAHAVVADPANPHQSILQGGGHHGSHSHMVHEFVRSIVEQRPAAIDAATGANWTAAGVCAHLSAMREGAAIDIPDFGALV